MIRLRPRLPHWTAHPGFGVLVLLVLAFVLIAHGEPQPSSRPSGTSVGVSGTASAAGAVPPLIYLRDGKVELRQQQLVRTVPLPGAAVPLAVVTGHDLSVVLAELGGRQRAYSISKNLTVRDLGFADAVIPSATGTAAVIVESALVEPGELPQPTRSATAASTDSTETTRPPTGQPDLRDFSIRRYDSSGSPVGLSQHLPPGTRVATDTTVGLVVWQPVNRVFDAGIEQESLSAAAILIRPDDTERLLGPVHPLAANGSNLLVWDVAVRRFGVMPLRYVTSTATSTASSRATPTTSASKTKSASASPSPTPTQVAGVRWFLPTRGMLLVTGPASFNADGSAFAVYAQVGSRRRLVVAELQNLGTDIVQVLALAAPPVRPSATPSGPATLISPSNTGATSASESASSTAAVLAPDGYPISAPLTPLWWQGMVVGLGPDGTVIGYQPGKSQSSLIDLGLKDIHAFAAAP